ncbi:CRISPR-associated protein, Cas5h family [Desulfonauticus submarinus]|uniref:CRISPR-associated protein, Cas5h family n=1 Tax=Desulfonauticus submarinus TaxID=206665 RepID=A0A1H0DP71_9BACT|nr:type I-B CRISPR-associated protein Cas5b [Desulfonauticus submarinus]SDN71955.1 CRISPR-associated protein, Cas5h family [Desulfonauticus submarinus]
MKIVVFDIWGDLGHFRVPYTTSSPLTFPIPPKTALYGIVGAVLGYDKKNYLEKFQNRKWKFAIGIKNKISTIRIAENVINTKVVKMFARMPRGKSCRTQINFEFLKNPYFRIYVTSLDNNELNKLKILLKEHKTQYTISLGISECLANFRFVGSFEAEKKQLDEFIEINSIIPLKYLKNSYQINFLKENRKYLRIHMPMEMKSNRELIESEDFILEAYGKTINVKLESYLRIEELNENIVIF